MTRAIILAAGKGTRLASPESPSKPLELVGGVPLIRRVIDRLARGGVAEVLVVVGYRGEQVRSAVEGMDVSPTVSFAKNAEYEKPNGTSLLRAASFVRSPTWLTMADHLWSPDLIDRVGSAPLDTHEAALGVDHDIARCFDLDDATKVRVRGDRILKIGKSLREFDALDTGLFRITPAFIDALRSVEGPPGCSLSDGVSAMAARGAMRAVDIGNAIWVDVDTPAARTYAEGLLAEGRL